MPTGQTNTKSRQFAIRLPHELYERITHYATINGLTQSQALVALLEKGLGGVHDTEMHRDAPERNAPSTTPWDAPAELAARLAALETAVSALQGASQTPPPASRVQQDTKLVLDPERHYLGPLCQRGHDWEGSGQSRYSKRNQACLACEAERARERRAARQ